MSIVHRSRSIGIVGLAENPIGPYVDAFKQHLTECRYAACTLANLIALWLGHESATTTHRYVEAYLAMKENALARLDAPDIEMRRYRARDSLMRFLQTL